MKMKAKNDCPKSRAMTKEFLDYYPVAHSNLRVRSVHRITVCLLITGKEAVFTT